MTTANESNYRAFFNSELMGKFESVEEAQKAIHEHDSFKKTHFTNRGKATSKNPDQNSSFKIYDHEGYGWNIK